MALQVGIREAKARLSALVGRARRGESVILTDRGRPVARLVAVESEELPLEDRLHLLEAEGLISAKAAEVLLPAPLALADEGLAQRYLREDRDAG
jgi:prevent-host-death family protein